MNWERYTVAQLKTELNKKFPAKDGYITGYSGWRKAELIDALKGEKEVPKNKNFSSQDKRKSQTKGKRTSQAKGKRTSQGKEKKGEEINLEKLTKLVLANMIKDKYGVEVNYNKILKRDLIAMYNGTKSLPKEIPKGKRQSQGKRKSEEKPKGKRKSPFERNQKKGKDDISKKTKNEIIQLIKKKFGVTLESSKYLKKDLIAIYNGEKEIPSNKISIRMYIKLHRLDKNMPFDALFELITGVTFEYKGKYVIIRKNELNEPYLDKNDKISNLSIYADNMNLLILLNKYYYIFMLSTSDLHKFKNNQGYLEIKYRGENYQVYIKDVNEFMVNPLYLSIPVKFTPLANNLITIQDFMKLYKLNNADKLPLSMIEYIIFEYNTIEYTWSKTDKPFYIERDAKIRIISVGAKIQFLKDVIKYFITAVQHNDLSMGRGYLELEYKDGSNYNSKYKINNYTLLTTTVNPFNIIRLKYIPYNQGFFNKNLFQSDFV